MKGLTKKQNQALYTIVGIIIVAIICTIIFQFYNSNNHKKILEASDAYQKALIASENSDTSLNTKISKFTTVVDQYPKTSFGIFASWQLADLYITPTKLDTNNFNMNITNLPKAIKVLQQSIKDNSDDSLTNVTKTRLARLYIASKQPDQAIKTLQSLGSLGNKAYPLMLLGQAYHQKNDKAKALDAWHKALQDPDSSAEFKEVITQLINNY
ncbi:MULTISPECIES: YfgM family protein [unclassified Francisella]|uniref:YfgM family protein n=1 Tax=unclassified Francisella TaxID=2610885 RepID=UPI002E34159F|nr:MULTISPECIES: tetratricopeptide repeat protein [unclassified Francisella]MED7818783.1 tetratricopeptide repeat protein [Francisella sp. 19S2-4]MED7829619.1 tetratricopeptide repeat protein [Francisella sp. 19S2-10]